MWDGQQYNITLQRERGRLWEPLLYLSNVMESRFDTDVGDTAFTVDPAGVVKVRLPGGGGTPHTPHPTPHTPHPKP